MPKVGLFRLLLMALLPALSCAAPLREVRLEGHGKDPLTTQPKVLLREMRLKLGEEATPERREQARQAIQDLGLFQSVTVREEANDDGVAWIYTLEERFYLLALPRVDYNVDTGAGYGAQITWNNVWGLNHSLRLNALRKENKASGTAGNATRGQEESLNLGYNAPFLFNETDTWFASASAQRTPVAASAGFSDYQENSQSMQVGLNRSLSEGRPSQGWMASGGLSWQQQRTVGLDPRPEQGQTTAPFVGVSYRQLQLNIFSEQGRLFSSSLQGAVKGWGSDHGLVQINARYREFKPLGKTPHQTWHLLMDAGYRVDGPPDTHAFGIGGSNFVRAYPKDSIQGNGFYRLGAEVARPLFHPRFRLLAVAEVGNADDPEQLFRKAYPSVGLGFRLRLDAFVDVEIEAGYAFGNPRGRTFAGRPGF